SAPAARSGGAPMRFAQAPSGAMRQAGAAMRGGPGGGARRAGGGTPAITFVVLPDARFEPRVVLMGVSDYDYAEIIRGLEAGAHPFAYVSAWAGAEHRRQLNMLIAEIVLVALGALRANKLRSFLTMLGIVIGVSAVITMVALGRGAQNAVEDRIASLGTTLLTVQPGAARGMGGVASGEDRARLTLDHAQSLAERVQVTAAVQPEMSRNLQVQYLNRNTNTSVLGTTANFPEVRKYEVEYGRMFTVGEDAGRQRVAVLGPSVVRNLDVQNPQALIGQPIRIRGLQFEVIGVLASKGQGQGWQDPDDQVLIPIQTARYRVLGTDRLRSISVL